MRDSIHKSTGVLWILYLLLSTSCGNSGNEKEPGLLFRSRSVQPAQPAFAQVNGDRTISDVAERIVGSVVNVSSVRRVQDPGWGGFPFGPGQVPRGESPQQLGVGSGVIVSADGLVVTNNHVIADAEELVVTTAAGIRYSVEVVGSDPPSDVAVLRLKGDLGEIRPLAMGSSDALRL
ncbi:MAG: S1C family serine protease, partial [Candidatus Latescibacterota bacterium]